MEVCFWGADGRGRGSPFSTWSIASSAFSLDVCVTLLLNLAFCFFLVWSFLFSFDHLIKLRSNCRFFCEPLQIFRFFFFLWISFEIVIDTADFLWPVAGFQLLVFVFFDYLLKLRIRRISISNPLILMWFDNVVIVDIFEQWPVCSTRGALPFFSFPFQRAVMHYVILYYIIF